MVNICMCFPYVVTPHQIDYGFQNIHTPLLAQTLWIPEINPLETNERHIINLD